MPKNLYISRKKHALWKGGYQGIALILNLVRGIVLVPLYLKYIPVTEYGFWIVLRSTIGWLFIINPGFADLLRARTAKNLGEGKIDLIWGDGLGTLVLNLSLSIVIMFAAAGASFFIPQVLGVNDQAMVSLLTDTYFILVGGMLLMLFAYVFAGINDGLQQGAQTGGALVIANIMSIGISIFCLAEGWGVYALAFSYIILPVIYLLITACMAVRNLLRLGASLSMKVRNLKVLANEAAVNFRGRAAGLIANSLDRWLVVRFLGPEAVVAYDMAKRVPETCFGMFSQFPHALAPPLSNLLGAGDPLRLAGWATRLFLILITGCLVLGAVIIALNRDFIGLWVGSQFQSAAIITVALVCWIGCAALINSAGVFFVAAGRVQTSANLLVTYSILLVPSLLIGIVASGLTGFVVAGAICGVTCVIWKLRCSLFHAYGLDRSQAWSIGRASVFALTMGIGIASAALIFPVSTWPMLCGKATLVCLIYGTLLILISPQLRIELLRMVSLLRMKINHVKIRKV